ncbi:guanyl-nucleotide exchange factor [Aureococcus anophagefferens]|uniref:Guanyl-nucleotide exchange factor n=1 Tax=Aureococcus anophagefferens TaxID=44056 RepID=A0ABR1FZB3_AURAN
MLLSASLGSLPGKKPRYSVKQARLKLLRAKEKLEREEGDLGELLASPGPDDEASTSPVARRPRRDLSRRDWPGESVESRPSTTLSRSSASRSGGASLLRDLARFDELGRAAARAPRASSSARRTTTTTAAATRPGSPRATSPSATRSPRRARRGARGAGPRRGRVHGWGGGAVFREAGAAAGRARNAPADVVARTLAPLERARARLRAQARARRRRRRRRVFTWGAGAHGRLGHGDGVSRVAPTRVAAGLPDAGVVIVAARGGARCAVVVARRGRRADGRLYTWGDGRGGQLGHGDGDDEVDASRKAAVPSQKELQCARARARSPSSARDATVRHVACGLHHTLAVAWEPKAGAYDAPGDAIALTARLYAWGFGDGGRLGTGEVSGACRFPARVLLPVEYGYDAADDAPRPHVVAAAAGDQHSPRCSRTAASSPGAATPSASSASARVRAGRAPARARRRRGPARQGRQDRRGRAPLRCVSEDGAVLLWGFGDEGQLGAGPEAAELERSRRDETATPLPCELAAASGERDATTGARRLGPRGAGHTPGSSSRKRRPKTTGGGADAPGAARRTTAPRPRGGRRAAAPRAAAASFEPAASFDGEADDPVAAFMGRAAAGASYVTAPADAEADDAGDDREADDAGDDEDAAPLDPVAAFMARSLGGGYKT